MESILSTFEAQNLMLSEFLLELLSSAAFEGHSARLDLVSNGVKICRVLHETSYLKHKKNDEMRPSGIVRWAASTSKDYYGLEISHLLQGNSTWKFSASHTTADRIQVEEFKIEELVESFQANAPLFWELIGSLLELSQSSGNATDVSESIDEDAYWENLDDIGLEGIMDQITDDGSARQQWKIGRKKALITIKKVVILRPFQGKQHSVFQGYSEE